MLPGAAVVEGAVGVAAKVVATLGLCSSVTLGDDTSGMRTLAVGVMARLAVLAHDNLRRSVGVTLEVLRVAALMTLFKVARSQLALLGLLGRVVDVVLNLLGGVAVKAVGVEALGNLAHL